MTEKSPADQRCRIGRCRTPLPALLLEAGTAGLLACTTAGQYPRTRPSLSLSLRHGLRLLSPSEEVFEVLLVKSGANTLCRHINCLIIHVAEILLWCRRKVMCTTVSYFLPRGSSSLSYTGLFLLFRKKLGGGGHGPPGPSPCYGTVTRNQPRSQVLSTGGREPWEQG